MFFALVIPSVIAILSASVAIDLVPFVVDDPDIGAICRDSLHVGVARLGAGRPRADQAATGVIDIDVLVSIDDPDLRPGWRTSRAAGRGVASINRVISTCT